MTVNDFNSYPLERRINEILEWGFSINKFHVNGRLLVRYSLHHFYAVMTLRHSDGVILDVNAFGREDVQAGHQMNAGAKRLPFTDFLKNS